ncbi:MAG: DUF2520 domain-containing protein [Firmicutes bacterium HGW-Firmicutes-13]|nr:MAG: DUF2520 domain-containing protein [Firmicutes bacterium HGW-Firmicutes-13]
MEVIGIVGAGNVGITLGVSLKERGYNIAGVISRTHESAQRGADIIGTKGYTEIFPLLKEANVIFITTPDRIIAEACKAIADSGGFKEGDIVIHTSGSHSSEILSPAREKGAAVLSVHPLQTIPGPEAGIRNLPGSYFAVEGDERGLPFVRKVIDDLNGHLLEIPTEMKPLYHASACVVSNYFVGIVRLGLSMMENIGVDKDSALAALLPLIQGTMQNIEKVGVPEGLTGPIARGDYSTIRDHLEVMRKSMPEIVPLYVELGKFTVKVALEKGTINQELAEQLYKVLEV